MNDKIYISTQAPITLDEEGFEALKWEEIGCTGVIKSGHSCKKYVTYNVMPAAEKTNKDK